MGQYDFSYSIPSGFDSRVRQLLKQLYSSGDLADALERCRCEREDLGNAYYAGMRGDNWNKKALDFTIEGPQKSIAVLKSNNDILKNAMSKALRSSESGFLLRDIVFLVVDDIDSFPSTNEERLNADIETARAVLADIIKIGERLSLNVSYRESSTENSINDYLRDALSVMGYNEVKDQTRHGLSVSGKDAGEVDILISKAGKEVAVIEGLKLSSVDSAYIDSHIAKAISNYNALGTATFIIAYICSTDFGLFWERYSTHLQGYAFPLQVKKEFRIESYPNAAARIASMVLSRDGFDFPVYFIALKLSG